MSTPLQVQHGPVTVFFGEKTGKYPDGNQVLVRGRDAVALFDMPQVAHRVGPPLQQADLVVLGHVHEDHMAGLPLVPGAEVHVHEADVEAARSWSGLSRHYGYPAEVLARLKSKIEKQFYYQPRPEARAYADGAVWDLGGVRVRAEHMPGHTAGHCVLLVEPHGIAFIGDIDLTGFGPYYGDATSDLGAFRRTLARLPDLPASMWITSHHRGVLTDREPFLAALQAFAAKIEARSALILERLADGPRTLAELVRGRILYPVGYEELWIDFAETRTIAMHLEELQADGRVRRVDEPTGEARWAACPGAA